MPRPCGEAPPSTNATRPRVMMVPVAQEGERHGMYVYVCLNKVARLCNSLLA
jgi:hypothetical protein